MAAVWKPDSWRAKPIVQVPKYPDQAALEAVERDLRNFPPLVFVKEVSDLKAKLAGVARGESFLLQGGDCAESFKEHQTNYIRDYFQLFLQMALILTFAGNSAGGEDRPRRGPVRQAALVRHGEEGRPGAAELSRRHHQRTRLHGRAPRSRPAAAARGLPAVGGDAQFPARAARRRLCLARERPALGTEVHGGHARSRRATTQLADAIKRTVEINRLLGITTENTLALRTTSFYTSHEALLLGYEQALTRRDELMSSGDYVATSGHMLWIGDRTRQPDGAHVEFCRGIVNPIGLKCGPSLQPDELLRLIDILNPKDEAGPPDADLPVRRRQGREASARR